METDFPDLDILINAAENSSEHQTSSSDFVHSGSVAFDPNEYADVVQWYNEQTQCLQKHYDTHLEYQKQKLAEENEAGLLEALQQTLDNIESDHMSDFACLSSTLDLHSNGSLPLSSNEVSPKTAVDSNGKKDPSLLKKLLLSPSNKNYPREVDSHHVANSNTTQLKKFHKAKISKFLTTPSPSKDNSSKHDMSKRKKPFTELLKHMETCGTDLKPVSSKDNSTRLVNTKSYMRKYGSAPSSPKAAPVAANGNKRFGRDKIKQPVAPPIPQDLWKLRVLVSNQPYVDLFGNYALRRSESSHTRNTKDLSVSLKTVSEEQKTNLNNGANINSTAKPKTNISAEKRRTSMLIDPIPAKRTKVSQETTTRTAQSHDHDYCSISVTSCRVTSAVVTTTQKGEPIATTTTPVAPCAKMSLQKCQHSKAVSAVTKVLKWEDYLQQVRLGTRSAPNSPTSSPKVKRGSGHKSNNFMVVSVKDSTSSSRSVSPSTKTSTENQKEQSTVSAPNMQDIRLQGVNEYINHLKKKRNNPKVSQDKMPLLVITTSKPQVMSSVAALNTSTIVPVKCAPASHALSAMVQKQKTMLGKGQQENMIKIKPQVVSTTEDVKKPRTSSVQSTTANSVSAGGSGQILMIRIPTTSGSTMTLPVLQKISNKTISLDVKHVDTANKNILDDVVRSPVQMSTSSSSAKSNINFICPHSTALNFNSVSNQMQVHTTTHSKVHTISVSRPSGLYSNAQCTSFGSLTKPPNTTPTFKLVTAKDEGHETKSLVLSGVTGPLKDILLRLAKQQADNKQLQLKGSPGVLEQPGELEQQTMQNLIDVVGSMKNSEKVNVVADTGKSDAITLQQKIDQINRKNPTNLAVACPTLTLAHEIKQNLSKKRNKLPVEKSAKHLKAKQEKTKTFSPTAVISNSLVNSVLPTASAISDSALQNPVEICSDFSKNSKDTGNDSTTRTVLLSSKSNEKLTQITLSSTMDATSSSNVSKKIPSKDCHRILSETRPQCLSRSDKNTTAESEELITFEDAMNSIEYSGEFLNSKDTDSVTISDKLFCKLPSYFLTGKLAPEKPGNSSVIQSSFDESKKALESRETEVIFSKLPHYFSSGKRSNRLTDEKKNGSNLLTKTVSKEAVVKLSSTSDTNLIALENGVPVDISETYYSRLPTYYSYGRPHPPLKTFNDAVADDNDDTVTPGNLVVVSENSEKRSKVKRKSKRKKKKNKHAKQEQTPNRVLYSKLPSYYLLGTSVTNKLKSRSVVSADSSDNSSIDSLYHSSGSYHRRSRKRMRNRRSRHSHSYKSTSSSDSNSRSRSRSPLYYRDELYQQHPTQTQQFRDSTERKYYSSSDDGYRRSNRSRDIDNDGKDKRRWLVKEKKDKFNQQALEERRVVYVGGITKSTTQSDLKRKFLRFGSIDRVTLHFRENGDNYGFITFQYTCDAFRAIEEGNKGLSPGEPHYDLCFGGRRHFCKTAYEDLDGLNAANFSAHDDDGDDFDSLLRKARLGLHR